VYLRRWVHSSLVAFCTARRFAGWYEGRVGLDPGSVRRSYDRVAKRYADNFVNELDHKPFDRALLSVVADEVGHRARGPIGDLGAGPRHVASFLAGRGVDVTVLDLSPAMAEIAHDRLGRAAVAGSLVSLPFGSGALDAAVAFTAWSTSMTKGLTPVHTS
jgi:SAM-dependent methyltransferase